MNINTHLHEIVRSVSRIDATPDDVGYDAIKNVVLFSCQQMLDGKTSGEIALRMCLRLQPVLKRGRPPAPAGAIYNESIDDDDGIPGGH